MTTTYEEWKDQHLGYYLHDHYEKRKNAILQATQDGSPLQSFGKPLEQAYAALAAQKREENSSNKIPSTSGWSSFFQRPDATNAADHELKAQSTLRKDK